MIRLAFALLLVSTLGALAREVAVTEQEQANILVICDLAAQSPAVARDIRASVAQFCIAWQRRIEAASTSPPAPEPAR